MPPEFELDESELASTDGHDSDLDEDPSEYRHRPRRQEEEDMHPHQHHGYCDKTPLTITPLFPGSPAHKEDESRPPPPRYMLTGALDSTIRLWDLSTGRCLRTFFGHVEGIWALAADTLRVVSGAEDRMVKVWDPKTGLCERGFVGHTGPVTCIGLSDSKLVTGSEDFDVRVQEFDAGDGGISEATGSG